MRFDKSSNPIFGGKAFRESAFSFDRSEVMTIEGAANKTGILLAIAILSAGFVWNKFFGAFNPDFPGEATSAVLPFVLGGAIGGFILAIITTFKPQHSGILAPIYAILEGLFLGGVSAIIEVTFGGGLVVRAVGLTFAVFGIMLLLYRNKTLRATNKFKKGVIAATGGIALLYFVNFIMSMFGAGLPFMYDNSLLGIGISLFIVVIAALNLILDFDFIERAAEANAPKYMEWYGAFGLMVTLVWLYLEILKLLARLASRD